MRLRIFKVSLGLPQSIESTDSMQGSQNEILLNQHSQAAPTVMWHLQTYAAITVMWPPGSQPVKLMGLQDCYKQNSGDQMVSGIEFRF